MHQTIPRPAAAPQALDREALAQDAGHVLSFLRSLEAALPGSISEELLALLEGAANPLALELLARALERQPQQPRR